jgi:amino acid adenylation domain-containing protein
VSNNQSLFTIISQQAENNPHKIAIIDSLSKQSFTYLQLKNHTESIVINLQNLGYSSTDRIATLLHEGIEMALMFLAISHFATHIPMNPAYQKEEVISYLEILNCQTLIVDGNTDLETIKLAKQKGFKVLQLEFKVNQKTIGFSLKEEKIASSLINNNNTNTSNTVLILLTSGTTSQPKIVPLTHTNINTATKNICETLQLTSEDCTIAVMPFFHIHGLSTLFATILSGGSIICLPEFTTEYFALSFQEFQPTWYSASPTIHQVILDYLNNNPEIIKHSKLRFIRSASAPMSVKLIEALEKLLQIPFIESYGMTEASPQIASNRFNHRKLGSVGQPINVEVGIISEDGHFFSEGETGEIVVRGENIINGYENNTLANEQSFIDGWFKTGDLGYLDEEGYLFITGRCKDIINHGGEKISPQEIETVLLNHPAVADVLCFPIPHPVLGENVGAVITLQSGFETADDFFKRQLIQIIREFVAQKLTYFKVPQTILIVPNIPKSLNGKIKRNNLAEKYCLAGIKNNLSAEKPDYNSLTLVEKELVKIYSEVLKIDNININDNFFSLGGDSLNATQIITRINNIFQVNITIVNLFAKQTIKNLAKLIKQKQEEKRETKTNLLSNQINTYVIAIDNLVRTQKTLFPVIPSLRGISERPNQLGECYNIKKQERKAFFPLSYVQKRIWFLSQIEPSNTYNMSVPLWLSGKININILEQSLNAIIERHEILRTNFDTIQGQPYQVIKPAFNISLPIIDLTNIPFTERETQALKITVAEAEKPFNLSEDRLIRLQLIKLEEEENILVITLHHIIADGWSTRILHREIGLFYRAILHQESIPLEDLPIQYADYTLWQEKWLQGEEIIQQLNYWKEKLNNAPPVHQLPLDKPRPTIASYQGARKDITISAEITRKLKSLAIEEGATLFMVLLAGFNILLSRYSLEDDILVGTPIANRYPLETENLIGCFVNTLVLRNNLSGNPSFREFLNRVKITTQEAFTHQDIPFDKVVEVLHPERDLSRMPTFQIMFAFQNLPQAQDSIIDNKENQLTQVSLDGIPFEMTTGLIAHPFKSDRNTSKFDLTLYLTEGKEGLIGAWQYNTDIFQAETIARLTDNFQILLQGISLQPDECINKLPLINEKEYYLITQQWQKTETFYHTHLCFHHLFEQKVEKTPNKIALESEYEKITYKQLNQQANQLAHYLKQKGVGKGSLVAILLSRKIETVITILAILKSGGAYLPIDLDYPPQRIAFILKSSKVKFIITNSREKSRLNSLFDSDWESSLFLLCLDDKQYEIDSLNQDNLNINITAENLAYIIYTSGTTGTPKGVMINHGNLSHYIQAMEARLGITKEDRYLHTAPFSFSSSVRQLVIPLSCGATIYLANSEQIKNPNILINLINQEKISVIDLVPSYQRIFLQVLEANDHNQRHSKNNHLKLILSASEPLSPDLPKRWLTYYPQAQFINMFGQTETSGIVSTYKVSLPKLNMSKLVPIGKAIANTHIYILDQHLQLVPIGVMGDIYISSLSVSEGYLHQPELMKKIYLKDNPDVPLYYTGDKGRYLADGNIEFVSRGDNQVKIRGFRVETQEIEIAIAKHHSIEENTVISHVNKQDSSDQYQRLVAFVVFKKEQNSSLSATEGKQKIRDLRLFLKQQLPEYMIPSLIIEKENLPRTPNGKLNHQVLIEELNFSENQVFPIKEDKKTPTSLSHQAIEEKLITIWQDVLNVNNITRDDNFFDVGGDSIVSTQIVLKANQAGINLTLQQLFQYQTIADLTTVLSNREKNSKQATTDNCVTKENKTITFSSVINSQEETVLVSIDKLRAYGYEALTKAGLVPEGAKIVTEVQLESSLRGQPTHNIGDIPRYAKRLSKGILNPQPQIKIEQETDFSAKIDGDNAPGQWVATVAMNTAIDKAKKTGLGIVAVRRSNHFGAAAQYAWMATQEQLIGLCTTNGPLILAPTGGVTPTFGNNPLAAGLPTTNPHLPIILDIAMSVAPRGKIGLQVAEGKPLAEGWILDSLGHPSTDLADLAAGLAIPIGEHKGYGLAFIFEALAGVLTGAGFCWDHYKHGEERDQELDLGHLFIAMNPEIFIPLPQFYQRLERMKQQTKEGQKAQGVTEIFVPGEIEIKARQQNLIEGIPLRLSIYKRLVDYGKKTNLKTTLN